MSNKTYIFFLSENSIKPDNNKAFCISHDFKKIVISDGKTLYFLNTKDTAIYKMIDFNNTYINSVEFSPNDSMLLLFNYEKIQKLFYPYPGCDCYVQL